MVSKHLLKSIKQRMEISPRSVAAKIRSDTATSAVSVECEVLKPCWVGDRRWEEERKS